MALSGASSRSERPAERMPKKLPPRGIVVRIAVALLIGTLLGLLPSGPFADLQFSYMTHSWYLYFSNLDYTGVITRYKRSFRNGMYFG